MFTTSLRYRTLVFCTLLWLWQAVPAWAYQVWEGMHCTPGAAATNLAAWDETAARVQGLNQNTAPNGGTYSSPTAATAGQWQTIFQQYTNASFSFCEMDRITISSNAASYYSSMTNQVESQFKTGARDGFTVQNIMIYNDVAPYSWQSNEVAQLRAYLDGTGRTNVGLLWDDRGFGGGYQGDTWWDASPMIDNIVLEAAASTWLTDANNHWPLLAWLWTNSATSNKTIIFQLPRSNNASPQYQATREVLAMLATNAVAGLDMLRSPRIVFLECNYGSYTFYPETTADGSQYTNSLTSMCISLIEQRAYFEGRTGVLPTPAAADSYARSPLPTLSTISNQTTANGITTAPISFTVGSPAFPAAALSVTATSSSAHLVPGTNIAISTWASTDLGSVGLPSTNLLGDVITMNTSGTDIASTADAGSFIWQSLPGDGALVARVTNLQPVNASAKAGVMIRANTNAGSPNCFLHVTAANGVEFTWRTNNNGATASNKVAGITAPCWLKLTKTGTNFAGYYALDNLGWPGTWTQVGATVGLSTMSSNLLAGLAGTAHNNATSCTAIFDNVSGNANRTITIKPATNQAGIATISLIANDSWFTTTNTFNLVVPVIADVPPTISNLTTNVVVLANSSTPALTFTVASTKVPADAVLVTGFAADTNLLPNANFVFTGTSTNRTVTLTPTANLTGTTTVNLVITDGTLASTNTFPLSVTSIYFATNTLLGNKADCTIATNAGNIPGLTLDATNSTTGTLGDGGSPPWSDRCAVYVFQLPNYGTVANPFTTAAFSFNIASVNSVPNCDLYGLPSRAAATVLTNDYYGQTTTPDPSATRIQTTLLTSSTPAGMITTSSSGNTALVNYLNAQYNGGAGAGRWVFLRIGTETPAVGINRDTLTMADGAVTTPSNTWPQINYSVALPNNPPVLAAISNRTIIAGQTLTFTNMATDSDMPPQPFTYSLFNAPAGAAIDPNLGVFTWRPTVAQSPNSYPVSVVVTEPGMPPLNATQNFTVTVNQPANPGLTNLSLSRGQFKFMVTGSSGPDYTVLMSTDLFNWFPLWTNPAALTPFTFTNAATNFSQGFYQVLLGP